MAATTPNLLKNIHNNSKRFLILVDNSNGLPGDSVFCQFDHHYDGREPVGVYAYFNDTFRKMKVADPDKIFIADEIPILYNIGNWRVTVITKTSSNEYISKNGENVPVADLMGLG